MTYTATVGFPGIVLLGKSFCQVTSWTNTSVTCNPGDDTDPESNLIALGKTLIPSLWYPRARSVAWWDLSSELPVMADDATSWCPEPCSWDPQITSVYCGDGFSFLDSCFHGGALSSSVVVQVSYWLKSSQMLGST